VKGKRQGILFLLLCFVILAVTGCSKKEEKNEKREYQMYYLSPTESSLETDEYKPTKRTTEAMVKEIGEMLDETPKKEEHFRLLPKDVNILECSYDGEKVVVNFNENYKKMKNTREILVRAGIVKAFTQIPGVEYVEFTENGAPMTDSEGVEIGKMDRNTFMENEGENVNSYVHSNLNLYFADESGSSLVKETVSAYYNSNVPVEREVVERLLKGPKTEGLKPTLSPNTKILGVSIVEGICYVNLDKSFLTDSMDVQEKLPIYSIVNSLTDACNIRAVQISVEGETKVTFRETMKLDEPYHADYGLLKEEESE
jgi:germination protein M